MTITNSTICDFNTVKFFSVHYLDHCVFLRIILLFLILKWKGKFETTVSNIDTCTACKLVNRLTVSTTFMVKPSERHSFLFHVLRYDRKSLIFITLVLSLQLTITKITTYLNSHPISICFMISVNLSETPSSVFFDIIITI